MACQPNCTTSTGTGKRSPSRSTSFSSSTTTTNRSLAAATIFSRNNAPPCPLIRSRRAALDLVGAVDREIDAAVLAEAWRAGCRAARAISAVCSEVGIATTDKPLRDAARQRLDDERGRRAGAEPEHHAALDEFDRALGGGALQPIARVRIAHFRLSHCRVGAEWRIAAIAAA